MNPVSGMFALLALGILVFFGLPITMTLALYLFFPPNFMKIGEYQLTNEPLISLQSDIPLPVSIKTQSVSFKMADGSSIRGYKAFPQNVT